MSSLKRVAPLVLLAALIVRAPSAAAEPLAGMHFLVGGTWKCTYRAAAARFAYDAVWAYDRGGNTVRETTSWPGGGDEEIVTYDPKHADWTAIVIEDQGSTTILRGSGSNANHIGYKSVYPDGSIVETFDRISTAEYTLRAVVRSGGTSTQSVDTCLRAAP